MIKIITTGGTIEGLDYENEKNRQIARMSIVDILEAANVSFKYKITEAFCKDSRLITIKDRIQLVSKIETSKEEKILITHGTITMLETAALLGQVDFNKTIVLVGSFLLGTEKNSDAPFNLGYAICALRTLEKGIYIAMNGQIFLWDYVIKNVADNRFEFLIN